MVEGGGDRWKGKYFEALEELEKKESDWTQANTGMRRGLSRLALAATGVDEALDIQLNKLRRAIQDNANSGQLDLIIEKISTRLKGLDEQAQQASTAAAQIAGPAQILLQLFDSIEFPKALRAQVKAFKRQLNDKKADEQLDELIRMFSQLIHAAFQSGETKNESGTDKDKNSWWNKVFSSGEENTSEHSPEVSIEKSEEQASVPIAGRTELEISLPQHPISLQKKEEDIAPQVLAKVFMVFLDQLLFPPQFDGRIQALKSRLESGLPLSDVAAMAKTVVNLVMEVRLSLEQEKEELEHFLKQLGIRIQELEQMVEGAETVHKASVESGHALDQMVVAQVNDIELSVQSAKNVDEMKLTIRSSLDHIRGHLAERREEETQREVQMVTQLKQLNERMSELEIESDRLRSRLAEERETAMTDPLTEIPNRLAYDKQVVKEFARWQRYNTPLCLLICDIDFFKNINDTYGHKAGDRALIAIAQTIQYNTRETDFLARIGGEEFIVLLSETTLEGARSVAEKIRRGIEMLEFVYAGQKVPITISGGVAEFSSGDKIDDVYVRADKGLYKAKEQGRNCFC